MASLRKFLNSYRNDLIVMALLFVAALGIRVYFLQFYRVISADGVGYAEIARDLFTAGGLAKAVHFPPFYPFLIAVVNLPLGDVELAGRIVSMAMGSLVVVPIYLLGIRFFDRRVALLACLLAIAWSSLRALSCEVMTQGTYITMLFTAVYLYDRAATRRSVYLSITTGAVMGLAYLTRPEAFIVYAVTSLFAVAYIRADGGGWREAAALVIPGWTAFWVLALPYVLFLHHQTGTWQLTAKTGATLWVGLGQYLGKFDVYREPNFKSIGFLDVIRDYPGFIPYNIRNNLGNISRELLPPYFWGLAVVGFIVGGWDRRKLIERCYLASTSAPLVLIIVFFLTDWAYTQFSLPVLFLWIGQGAVSIENSLARLFPAVLKPFLKRNLLSVLIIGALSLNSLVSQLPKDAGKPYDPEQDGGRYDHKRIGLLLRKNLPAGSKIMTRSGRISFYSGLPTVYIPQADLAAILTSARESKVRFLIVDGSLEQLRPQLEPLFLPLRTGPENALRYTYSNEYQPISGVRLYLIYRHPASQGVAVYELVD